MLTSLLVVLALLVVVALVLAGVYNRLVTLRERVRTAFAQIDVQLERRHDLIPNLVETAKGYLRHERATLEAVVQARAAATQARVEVSGDSANLAAMGRLGATESALGGALGRLLAVAEAYPDLKADRTMMQLTEELTTTENKIAFARQNYNDQVNTYQTYKASFPPVLIAGSLGFRDSAYLSLDATAEKRENVAVSFDDVVPSQRSAR
ncbi:LemA family protein [Actinotalea sp.]|uniref:LemA family protein n=1 Tax=Actinotalea sp. TaxID=1872145 RepID=UPI003564AF6C